MLASNIPEYANSSNSAHHRIDQYMKHGDKILDALEKQYSKIVPERVDSIYKKARAELEEIKTREHSVITKYGNKDLSKNQVKLLAKAIKKAHSEIATIVLKTQKEVRAEAAKILVTDLAKEEIEARKANKKINRTRANREVIQNYKSKINFLSKESFIHQIAQKILTTFSKKWQRAAQALKNAEHEMVLASHDFTFIDRSKNLTQIEKERVADHIRFSSKRKGVMIVQGEARVRPEFTIDKVKKQLKSFQAQFRSEEKRVVLTQTFSGILEKPIEEKIIPLNAHFDERVGVGFFEEIVGKEKGISSLNRQEKHIINGYLSTLGDTFKSFRHGALSSLLAPNEKIRQDESDAMAQELIVATLLETLKTQGLSLEQASKSDKPISLNLTSVSLVTPDYIRSISFLGQRSERKMLENQFLALNKANEMKSITINNLTIPLNVKTRTFNFGVNEGAIGKLKFAPDIKMGLDTQYEINDKSWISDPNISLVDEARRLINSINVKDTHSMAIELLLNDLSTLLFRKENYLEGSQYEAGAKIINLCNLMTEYSQLHKQKEIDKLESKLIKINSSIIELHKANLNDLEDSVSLLRTSVTEIRNSLERLENLPPEYSAAFNCFSGKDRTGIMDCIAKAFHLMYLKNGKFPTSEELNSPHKTAAKEEFADIVTHLLLESGNLEITEINGARGFKITENSAAFAGLPLGDFLLKYSGLGKTTSS